MNQPAAVLERKFAGLAAKIQAGECVLVLGPRISAPVEIAGSEVPIDDYFAGKLREDLDEGAPTPMDLRRAITRHEREIGASACRSLIQEFACDFDQYTTDLHRDLATLPFRLILVATPDRMMATALRAQGKQILREAYYDYVSRVSLDIGSKLPSADSPIVYSLFGRHDHPETMVLNDKNLLDYLIAITKESPKLPDAVRLTLRHPSTIFLFVGFGFTNWWLRLLLKVLEVTGVENRLPSFALEDSSTFAAVASSDNKGFFQSAGINILADDWNALAKDLAARVHKMEAVRAAAPTLPTDGSNSNQGQPLVFLSYASEDVDKVDWLRVGLQDRGVSVWQDKQNLSVGQNWDNQISRVIKGVDYFVFVQTENMDERDLRSNDDGVYNRELKRALQRVEDKPSGKPFLFHVTFGTCRQRNEQILKDGQHIAVDTDSGVDQLAKAIIAAYQECVPDSSSAPRTQAT